MMKRFLTTVVAAGAALCSTLVLAQAYPAKPVKIVAAAAGGFADLLPRLLGAKMQERTGQPWIVEPRLGANGVKIGRAHV